jgi:fumarate hydratase subunit alpha
MKMTPEEVYEATAKVLVQAGTSYTPGLSTAYARALEMETEERARWAMQQYVENAEAAKRRKLPLCNDSGIPHVLIQVGDEAEFGGPLLKALPRDFGACPAGPWLYWEMKSRESNKARD